MFIGSSFYSIGEITDNALPPMSKELNGGLKRGKGEAEQIKRFVLENVKESND